MLPRFKRELQKKPPALQRAILQCVASLVSDPRHPGLQVHQVQGTAGVWEAYVDRKNRITFHFEGGVIVLRRHCNHDIITRWP